MNHSITIAAEGHLIHGSLRGTASLDGLRGYIAELLSPPCVDVDYPVLSDLRELDMQFMTADDVRKVVEHVALNRDAIAPVKHAILVSHPVSFGLARMYELLAQETDPQQIGVFYDAGEARTWLAEGAS
jgi:hypothetical protein